MSKELREKAKWVKIPGTNRSYFFPFAPRRMDIEVLRANKKGFKGVIIKEVR